jgi:hypothetical protein
MEASSAEGVMVIPGHLISVPHLQASARTMQQQRQQQQQQQQQAKAAAGSTGCNDDLQQLQDQQQAELAPSPYFRVSFVSVGPEAIKEGIKRLGRAVAAISSSSSVEPAKLDDEIMSAADQGIGHSNTVASHESEKEHERCATATAAEKPAAAAPLAVADVNTGSAASAAQFVAAAAASAAAAAAASYGKGGVSLVSGVRVWR